jgi:hypothetical protein
MTFAGRAGPGRRAHPKPQSLSPFRGGRGGAGVGCLALLVFLGAVVALVWMALLPHLVSWRLEAKTGFPTRIERLVANPFAGSLRVEGLVMENPAGFEPRTFLAVNTLALNVRLTALLRKELIFDEVVLDLARVSVVTRADGANNLGLLVEGWSGGDPATRPAPRDRPDKAERPWLVRRLELRLGTVEIVNAAARPPERRELVLNHVQTLHEVSTFSHLLTPELMRSLPGLGGVLGWVRAGTGFVAEAGRRPWARVNSLFRRLEESAGP